MELPRLAPAPVVTDQAAVFRDLVDHQCQFRPVQHSLTGLMGLPTQRLATMARCILDRADNTPRSRGLAEAPGREPEVNRRRHGDALVVLDATRGEPGGSRGDPGDRHDHHGDGTDPRAHHPVTRVSVRGPVRFPLDLRR